MLKKLLCAVALLCAYAGAQQINPNTQIRWGAITNTTACHFGLTLDASGNISLGGCNGVTLQTNGTPNASQSMLNFLDSPTVTWTNPSGGIEQATVAVSGGFQMYTPPPITGQSVLVPATAYSISGEGDGCVVSANNTSGQIYDSAGGLFSCNVSPGAKITWSNFTLPGDVDPATVTAVYAVATAGYNVAATIMNITCSAPTFSTGVMDAASDPAFLHSYSAQLTWATGATIGTVSCAANIAYDYHGGYLPKILNIPYISLLVYYTGTAPPASNATNVAPPLYLNTATNTMSVSAVNLASNQDGGVTGLLPQANLAPPAQTTLNGTTAGTAVWSQPQQFSTWKQAVIYLDGYENTTATAQTITLSASFASVSAVLTDTGDCTGLTVSGATVTFPASMSAAQTGLCEIRGW